jgi:POT family proton-dependent oligopeptide transporter
MWERFGFYTMAAMFVLYLRNPTQGFGWTAENATVLNSYYLMFVYASPLVGGLIADRGLGYRNSVLLGGLVFMVGYLLFTIHSIWAVYGALALLVVGNGFFKPNVSAMVGQLYPENSSLKDRAYNIFYMGINIGALLAPVVAELMVNGLDYRFTLAGTTYHVAFGGFGYRPAFAVAAAGMVASVLILWSFKRYVEKYGATPGNLPAPLRDARQAAVTENLPPGATSEAIETAPQGQRITAATPPPQLPNVRLSAIEAVPEARRITALLVIFLLVIVFWMVFMQGSSTLTYWADENTAWNVSGIFAASINPFWVIILTMPVVWFLGWLNARGLEPSTPAKMGLGMFLTAAAFCVLYFAARIGEAEAPRLDDQASFRIRDRTLGDLRGAGVPDDLVDRLQRKEGDSFVVFDKVYGPDDKGSGKEKFEKDLRKVLTSEELAKYQAPILEQAYLFKVSWLWLVMTYMVLTLGELMLSPMGLSLVSKVAPVRMRGLMMGGWFVSTAIGNKLTAIGVYYDRWLQSTFFLTLAACAAAMGVVLFILLRPLKKAMPGV